MFLFVLTLHFVLCAVLVVLVLMQQGKGADMGAAFGSGGSNSLFGAGGATTLFVRITTAVAVAFMITSITLINLSGSESGLASISAAPGTQPSLSGSVMEGVVAANPTTAATNEATIAATPGVVQAPSKAEVPAPQAAVAPIDSAPINSNPVNSNPAVASNATDDVKTKQENK